MLNFIMNYWYFIVIFIAVGAVASLSIYTFLKKPTSDQITQIKEWLLWAVTEAEKALGSGTGALKLRYVYDLFTSKFPAIAPFIPFSTFSGWVDEVLEKFRKMLETNDAVKTYVNESEAK